MLLAEKENIHTPQQPEENTGGIKHLHHLLTHERETKTYR